jgi:redox-sensitive bicupin YhaK (pirin superfamily)
MNIASPKLLHPRTVERLVSGRATSDGAGVKLTRVLTQDLQNRLDPFLMLDAFGSDDPNDYLAGFPDHPHRGFETVTYMIQGRMRHRDSAGHEGLLENGGVQWMTAGRGLIHSELPEQEHGVMEGFQLWLNLPAKHKMIEPWYRDIRQTELTHFENQFGVKSILIAGASHGLQGAITRQITEPCILDAHFPTHSEFSHAFPATHNALVYVYRGAVNIAGTEVNARQMAILSNHSACDGVHIRAENSAKVLLITGSPLREPIAQQGPFVMNTQEEIYQALRDYRDGQLG